MKVFVWKDILPLIVQRPLFGWGFSNLADGCSASGQGAVAAGILAGLAGYFLWLQSAWSHIGPANVFWTLAGISVALERSAKEAAASPALTAQP
jgi:hypothetical protein